LPNSVRCRATRILGSLWFLLLAVFVARGLATQVSAISFTGDISTSALSSFCQLIFYATLGILILIRPHAKAQATSVLPKVAAFVGTYLPWSIIFTARTDYPGLALVSSACVLIGMFMTLLTLRHLGRSFSLVPQARRVVQTGPYRWIRHPLYLAEELAFLGVVLQHLSPMGLVVLAGHIAAQVCRIHYEEELLRRTLPDYMNYAAARWRLVPYMW
jgi:protein-S-isoprenylcysteine O-methyltransferase Ste14